MLAVGPAPCTIRRRRSEAGNSSVICIFQPDQVGYIHCLSINTSRDRMLLQDVLDGTAPARLVLVHHSIAAPAWPLLHELTQRAQERYVFRFTSTGSQYFKI